MPTNSRSSIHTVLCAAALLAITGQALAAEAGFNAKVTRVLVTGDSTFGGCMASFTVDPQTQLGSCGKNWVTFSCSGHFTNPVRAYRLLDQAQLALATGKRVYVRFRNDKKHNGYCFVSRIDVLR